MVTEIKLHQPNYSKATFDNGILIIEKRTGGNIRHKNVPWAIFNALECSGNSDSYYEQQIHYKYPIF